MASTSSGADHAPRRRSTAGNGGAGAAGRRRTYAAPEVLPEPLRGATQVEIAGLKQVPTSEALDKWLRERGVETETWGKEKGTKDVGKFWKELKLEESGLEVWRTAKGVNTVVRVTHVLRAKVCSPQSYERGVFLFNTWQQFGDGKKRTRNALLSEKLSTAEIPLEDHLHEVCERAVTEEEMARVVDAAFTIAPGNPAPPFDPTYVCPLKVVQEYFVDHTIEVEVSKSYPGLLTMYHLYTVDILCSGLPGLDFNTLEFDHGDKDGNRPLKYIHAWKWLDWSRIQRYLFEGSELKERKKRGAFNNEGQLENWLSEFDLDLDEWGKSGFSSIKDLHDEVENDETQLEVWSRFDGVPLLMRVLHVLQLRVTSSDPRLEGKFLFQTWQQNKDGRVRTKNRLMSKKLKTEKVPFEDPETHFAASAEKAVLKSLSYVMDAHFKLQPSKLPKVEESTPSGVSVVCSQFASHHFDIDASPTFKDMHTMYHIYSMELECEGLPLVDFTTLNFDDTGTPRVIGWRWVTWPEILDILHARTQGLERKEEQRQRMWSEQCQRLTQGSDALARLTTAVEQGDSQKAKQLLQDVRNTFSDFQTNASGSSAGREMDDEDCSIAKMLPPTMVAKMSSNTITSDKFLEDAREQRVTKTTSLRRESGLLRESIPEEPSFREASAPQTSAPHTGESAPVPLVYVALGIAVVAIAIRWKSSCQTL